jgi:hypothetical protein
MLALVHRITARIPQLQRANLRFFLTIASSPSQRRYALSWLLSLQEDYLLRRRQPWLTYDAIRYLTNSVGSNLKVFEFGSGGSTLFWLPRAAMCVSVEHDPGWVARLRPLLSQAPQVDLRLVLPQPIEGQPGTPAPEDFADPTLYLSSDPAYAGVSFWAYASQIDAFPDGFFDVVLVDGRARPSCVAHGAAKVREGGLFILDNANIPHYLAQTRQYLSDFDVIEFSGVAPIGRVMAQTNLYWRRKGLPE